MAGETVIETRALSKVYRDFWGRQKVRALKALDLEIKQGEIFGLLGPNGSGKTTTIKLLLGLLFPTEGQALVFGKTPPTSPRTSGIGYLPEESYLYRFLNAEETLDFYGRLFDMPARRAQAAGRRADRDGRPRPGPQAAAQGIFQGHDAPHRPGPGADQRPRADPARRADQRPRPDRHARDEGPDPRAQGQGKTVVMCSHLLADVQDVCDRIAILHQGELKELGRVDEPAHGGRRHADSRPQDLSTECQRRNPRR